MGREPVDDVARAGSTAAPTDANETPTIVQIVSNSTMNGILCDMTTLV